MLATSSWDGTTQFHSLTDGRRLLLLKQEGGDLVFSLDGTHFAFRGPKRQLTLGEIGWHRIARDLGGGEMPAADEGMHEVEFSTDSQWLTSAAPNGVQVFEVEHGTLQSTVSTAPARTVMLVGDHLWIQGPPR